MSVSVRLSLLVVAIIVALSVLVLFGSFHMKASAKLGTLVALHRTVDPCLLASSGEAATMLGKVSVPAQEGSTDVYRTCTFLRRQPFRVFVIMVTTNTMLRQSRGQGANVVAVFNDSTDGPDHRTVPGLGDMSYINIGLQQVYTVKGDVLIEVGGNNLPVNTVADTLSHAAFVAVARLRDAPFTMAGRTKG